MGLPATTGMNLRATLLPCGFALPALLAACEGPPGGAAPARGTEVHSAETAGLLADAPLREKLPTPAAVEAVPVSGDAPAYVVRGRSGRPPAIVFLPGVCSNASAYLHTFPEAAAAHGGVVAIDGDEPCPGVPGFHTFSWDTQKQHRRLEAALAAAGARTPREGGVTLVGYSQGATIGEKLVYAYPERYSRVMLIAAPVDPSVAALRSARAAVTCACSLDVTQRMRSAALRLSAGGVPSTYLEMPGCTHGNVAKGEETFGAAFAWLDEHARQ
ncbi:MAG: alpha/beta hydrolase [Myxococcales bacterium]|nr:alpha/beta hydrolase [Myxococcales bacterium]HQY60380.1 alpha/beta hydrolase [Polyangiaceae bacterium]